ncbi:Uncharacterised protein [Campylobacter hyointestinalis subsp. hyointestinalis]|uniref:Uncharacterized protein n=1 Tax=Campylobacter hyointestinalis subsp. hyointestinalis TaxID=91352 RepID=A0A9W5ANW8_CAMHY|nr:hypothetical protein [Campylobacter hyointestinalis]CUU77414.1 Uncharacterised protein [Campylobacter hyointestinalis subsp. hyointestinalis]
MIVTVNKHGDSIYKSVSEYKDFDFKASTCVAVIKIEKVNPNKRGSITTIEEQTIKFKQRALKWEIDRCEDDINSGEFKYNAKNQRYIANLYRALKAF